jgi:hypothetical protein
MMSVAKKPKLRLARLRRIHRWLRAIAGNVRSATYLIEELKIFAVKLLELFALVYLLFQFALKH